MQHHIGSISYLFMSRIMQLAFSHHLSCKRTAIISLNIDYSSLKMYTMKKLSLATCLFLLIASATACRATGRTAWTSLPKREVLLMRPSDLGPVRCAHLPFPRTQIEMQGHKFIFHTILRKSPNLLSSEAMYSSFGVGAPYPVLLQPQLFIRRARSTHLYFKRGRPTDG